MNEQVSNEKKPNKNASLMIVSQYIKDLSFENPNAPFSFNPTDSAPDIQVSLDLGAKDLNKEGRYEVILHVKIEAKHAEKVMFILELSYAIVALLKDIDEQHVQSILFVDVPYLMFPFARQIVADVTRNGGFVPLMLDPINFTELFNQRHKKTENTKAN